MTPATRFGAGTSFSSFATGRCRSSAVAILCIISGLGSLCRVGSHLDRVGFEAVRWAPKDGVRRWDGESGVVEGRRIWSDYTFSMVSVRSKVMENPASANGPAGLERTMSRAVFFAHQETRCANHCEPPRGRDSMEGQGRAGDIYSTHLRQSKHVHQHRNMTWIMVWSGIRRSR